MGWTRRQVATTITRAMEEHNRAMGLRARGIRESLTLTQEDVARRSGLTVKTISRFENGRHEGRSDTLRRIAAALGVQPEDIKGPPVAPLALGGDEQLDRIEAKLDALLKRLPNDESPPPKR